MNLGVELVFNIAEFKSFEIARLEVFFFFSMLYMWDRLVSPYYILRWWNNGRGSSYSILLCAIIS